MDYHLDKDEMEEVEVEGLIEAHLKVDGVEKVINLAVEVEDGGILMEEMGEHMVEVVEVDQAMMILEE